MSEKKVSMDELVALCKSRGFIFPGSEIYGGLANSWDYGPLGVELINNIKKAFWEFFVYGREDIVGLDAAILMNPKVWKASGHLEAFHDPLVDCSECKHRFRGDKLIEEYFENRITFPEIMIHIKNESHDGRILEETKYMAETDGGLKRQLKYIEFLDQIWKKKLTNEFDVIEFALHFFGIQCPNCEKCKWSKPKNFNLMFKTHQGVTEDSGTEIYLRPETAQGIFTNFLNVQRTTRKKLPFGIAQIGKAFRNEITPGNFIFRTREFEQMEIEYFFDPEKEDWKKLWKEWTKLTEKFITEILGIDKRNIRLRDHDQDELSHYSKGTTDIEYEFPFGWGELCAAGAYRTDFDLSEHQKESGESMEYLDPESGKKFIPHVIEPSIGTTRPALAILLDAYHVEKVEDETRVVMKFLPHIAPVKVAVFPLMKKEGLPEKAREIVKSLCNLGNVEYDETGSIGKRYRRHDEIGTPACVTVDYDTLKDDTMTVRDRDTMKQERVKGEELLHYLGERYFW